MLLLVTTISVSAFNFETSESDVNVNIYINITNLTELGDVNIAAPNNNEVVTWNTATSRWIAQSVGALSKWIIGASPYWYNSSDTIYFNETQLNLTIDARAGSGGADGNASSICSGTTTYLDGEGNCDNISGVYAPVNYGDNWNKTYADTLYASAGSGNASWNESYAHGLFDTTYNATYANNASYLSTYNASYDKWAYNMSDGNGGLWETNGTIIYNNTASQFGMGTSTPLEFLHILGDTIIETTDAYGVLHFGNYPDQAKIMGYDNTGGSVMAFYAGGQEMFKVGLAETVVNEGGLDGNFRIESANNAHIFFVDSENDRVGIGTTNPTHELNVIGDLNVTGNYIGDGSQLTGISSGGNASWNESYAHGLFDTTYNATYAGTTSAWDGNSSALIGCVNNASYLSTYNACK